MPRAQILVVDDEPSILSTLKKVLSLEGYGVDVAGGVTVAESKLAKQSYDVVMLDVALPDGDGLSLLSKLMAGGLDAQVIMMSGHATIDAAVRATRLGALDFLEKPLSTDRLLVVLDNALRLKRAEAEAAELRRAAGLGDELLGESRPMLALREQVLRAAKSNASVLVIGERGTGKELIARAIHRASPRAKGPLERLNCAAVPADLIESELFGHEAGAFTGATKQRRGKFERVGGGETFKVDVRVVAATNKDLRAGSAAGTFRADLYDRLNVLPLDLPPLRARRDDVPLLAAAFLKSARLANGRPGLSLSDGALKALTAHSFPGNVRELRNVIERIVILNPDDDVTEADVQRAIGMAESSQSAGLYRPGIPFRVLSEEAERTILEEALAHHGGQMAATARALGLERSHLYKKAKALGLRGAADSGSDE